MNSHKVFLAIVVSFLCGAALLSAGCQNPRIETPKNFETQKSLETPQDLVQQLITHINANENNFSLSETDLKNLKYELHDLNADETQEIFLYIEHSDWCGAGGGNCLYRAYQKTEEGYRLKCSPLSRPVFH